METHNEGFYTKNEKGKDFTTENFVERIMMV